MNIRKIKWLGIIFASCLSTAAFATGAGFYLGAQLGLSNTNNKIRTVQVTPPVENVQPSNTGIGGRIFAGYGFNQYAALEGGFTRYAPSTYNVTASGLSSNPTIRENGMDVVAKGMYPIYSFAVFGKAGIAFVWRKLAGSLTTNANESNGASILIRPTAALGVSYDFSQNWVGELTYSRVLKGGGLQNADLIALGVSYHFVDVYCGQFLC